MIELIELEVLLAGDGSEKSIRKLKEKYNLKNKDGKELFVTLATQKQEGYRSSRDIILGIHGILQ